MAKRGPKVRSTTAKLPLVDVPEGLTPEERCEFVRLTEATRAAGTLDRCDVRMIQAAARCSVMIDRAQAELAKGPLTLPTNNGMLMPHPMIAVIATQTMRLRGLWRDLGLTPESARLGKGGARKGEGNKWEGLISDAG